MTKTHPKLRLKLIHCPSCESFQNQSLHVTRLADECTWLLNSKLLGSRIKQWVAYQEMCAFCIAL